MSAAAATPQGAIAIDIAASDWAVRHARGLSEHESEAFDRWFAQDRRHAGSFLRASALICMAEQSGEPFDAEKVEDPAYRPSRRQLLIGGGAFAGIAAGILAFVTRPGTVRSALGETRSVPLRDGSTALLNTDSVIRVDYSKQVRAIDVDAGEAWFDVAHDTARPFVVSLGTLRVKAVGTAFAVRRLTDGSEMVTVTEGVVLAWVEGKQDAAIRIAAGGRGVAIDGTLHQQFLGVGQSDSQLAWRTGMIVLDGQTLVDAVEDFNRYNPVKLVVLDRALGRQRIYGTFRARDPQALAHAVAISLNTSAREENGSLLIGVLKQK